MLVVSGLALASINPEWCQIIQVHLKKRQLKVKVKVHTLDIAPLRESSPQNRSGMARVLKGFHSFTCTPTHSIRNRNEPYLPFPFQLNLILISPTPGGWKAELAELKRRERDH